MLVAVPGFSITARVYNDTQHAPVAGQTLIYTWLTGNVMVATGSLTTDGAGAAEVMMPGDVSPDSLTLKTSYQGFDFYMHTLDVSANHRVTLNLYDPAFQPQALHIKLFQLIITGEQTDLVVDVRMVLNNQARTCFVSGNYGFVYPLVHDATFLFSSPWAVATGNHIFFRDTVRPGETFYAYTYRIPFRYDRPLLIPIPLLYPIDNLFVLGDDKVDLSSIGAPVRRQIRSGDNVNIAVLTAHDLTSPLTIQVIPVQNRHFFFLEIAIGLLLGGGVLILVWLGNRPVPSYKNLVSNITNREQYDQELKGGSQ